MVQGILANAKAGCTPEEIATQIFEVISLERRILASARRPAN
jgi:hypothetical protein